MMASFSGFVGCDRSLTGVIASRPRAKPEEREYREKLEKAGWAPFHAGT
jgi:hypothetical protein